jgi:hypothetical protein
VGPGADATRVWLPVAHGWNIDSAVVGAAADLSTAGLSGLVGNGLVVRVGGWCTLLGPEGPGFPGRDGPGVEPVDGLCPVCLVLRWAT